jgi:hypothetical protein
MFFILIFINTLFWTEACPVFCATLDNQINFSFTWGGPLWLWEEGIIFLYRVQKVPGTTY